MSDVTLYFLQSSRAIRIAWLLEELAVPYNLRMYTRNADKKVPPELKAESGTFRGKSPCIHDGDLVVEESGAITEYLVESYDRSEILMPKNPVLRAQVRAWIHAAEGTFMLNGLALFQARAFLPSGVDLSGLEKQVKQNSVRSALLWIEDSLAKNGGPYLVGKDLTAADTMMGFSARWLFDREIAEDKDFPGVARWLEACEGREAYKKAKEKTGHFMPKGSGR